jgi:PHD/YefM family antitoxin component YafN of YafNO toxin-antitoxin module
LKNVPQIVFLKVLIKVQEGEVLIQAKDIKKRGVSFLSEILEKEGCVFISLRGKPKYVVLKVEDYERLRELELEAAIKEAERDLEEERYIIETAEDHFKRLGI